MCHFRAVTRFFNDLPPESGRFFLFFSDERCNFVPKIKTFEHMEKSDILIGRKKEIETLQLITESREAEFVVVYGRRRVGKTFLVNHFFQDQYAFKATGLAKKDKRKQLSNFAESLNLYGDGQKYAKPKTWFEAFSMLRHLLEKKVTDGKKKIVFIDELPWMDTRGSNLVSALEHFWNDWANTQGSLVLIICGSATSWMTKKILKNRGGLHNRVTQKVYLHPFRLAECKAYLEDRGIVMDEKDIAECYMVMGGIPYYLKNLRRGRSLAQNIDEMFFLDKGRLDGEFDALYASLFDKSENYIKVVEALSGKKKGLTREEILKATKLKDNGHFSTILKDLIDCEFIRQYKGYGKTARMSIFQLIDPFTLFYFNFIKPNGTSEKAFWQFQIGTRKHDTWAGLAFEQLCLNHHSQIEQKLGITGVQTKVFSWRTSADAEEHAQIDLIIQRADNIVNLCEMKFYDGTYAMTKKDRSDIERRVRAFKNGNKVKGAVHPVLVTTFGLRQNEYSSIFQAVVTLDDLFQ